MYTYFAQCSNNYCIFCVHLVLTISDACAKVKTSFYKNKQKQKSSNHLNNQKKYCLKFLAEIR